MGVPINYPSGYSYLSQKEKSLPGIFVDDSGKYTGIQGGGWSMLMAMIRQDIGKGLTKDGGAFVGQNNGYSINEGTELEVMSSLQQYVPFCTFKVLPVATESQVNDMIKALIG